jgi:hypothetical protein
MKSPAIRRIDRSRDHRHNERGVTMALVAIAMVAIIAMAALSVDLVTLFLAHEEAQRSADAGALAAARIISLSGLTGDPYNSAGLWQCICGTPNGNCGNSGQPALATVAADTAVAQSTVAGSIPGTINVTYSASGTSSTDCSTLSGTAFGANPMVTVQITRSSVPTFFSRIWGKTGNNISATATAEAFNPSFSAVLSNQGSGGTIIPVEPRCVKPWIIPNQDPLNPPPTARNPNYCTGQNGCTAFVDPATGQIEKPGISLNGTNVNGVIGERFLLIPDCTNTGSAPCDMHGGGRGGVEANHPVSGRAPDYIPTQPNLEYLPGQAAYSSVAVPMSASGGSLYEQAVAGCDETTVYQCGVSSSSAPNGPNQVDLSENPAVPFGNGDTMNGVVALIHEGPPATQPQGQDYFNPIGQPASYPFPILAGTNNPMITGVGSSSPVSSSPSIVSLPIYDSLNDTILSTGTTPVTIVGFLQVFINAVDQYGNVDVTVLNVVGCGNGSNSTGTAVAGSSPVPVRLITPP